MKINFIAICLSVVLLLNVVMVLNIPLVMGDDWSASCSSNCTCKWTNGKKSAICSSLQLTTIPTTLSTEIQVLVLNDNHIAYLNQDEFNSLDLSNLQRIYLKKSDLQYIHKDAFKNLKILVEIDLSDNKIEMLDRDTFMGNDRLRILYLNGNPLKKLIAYQFPILPHLRTLDLHDCLISYIDPMALANLNLLEFLYLKNNLLESLSEYVFQHMSNLKTLVLDDNPWQCNCKLRKFRTWYVKSKVNSIDLLCKGPPAFKEKYWDQIDEKQFGCPPRVEIFNNDDVQNIDIGSNTTFSCLIYGDPLPDVSWQLNGKILDNDNVIFDQETIASDKLWSNVTVFNMTSLDAGIYSCAGENVVGAATQNISIYLTEIVQHVLVKTPETFWYFGLIMGTFGTIFLLISISFVVCLCKRTTQQRRHPNKNGGGGGGGRGGGGGGMKGSVSFNDQEKKLLDLSITTTTNERGDSSCGIDNNTSSMNKTESVIGFEPIEITVENHHRGMSSSNGGVSGNVSVGHMHHMSMAAHHSLQQQQQQQQKQMISVGQNNSKTLMTSRQQMLTIADGSCSILGIPSSSSSVAAAGGTGSKITTTNSNQIPEEFPLNVGVFPPPPEFCSSNVVTTNPAYGGGGNIFISVSVTQDMLDNSDINIYPDLLNIPKRIQDNNNTSTSSGGSNSSSTVSSSAASSTGTMVPVSSFATLPRNNQRRGILKKDSWLQQHQHQHQLTNLYPHDEIVSYHNLETSYSQGYQEYQQQLQQHQHQQQQHYETMSRCSDGVVVNHNVGCYQCSQCPRPPPGGNVSSHVISNAKGNCVNCMPPAPPPLPTQTQTVIAQSLYARDTNTPPVCNTPPQPPPTLSAAESSASCALASMRPLCKTPSSCLKYDNMGRRITASGNSILSLPDEERLENETLFNNSNPLTQTGFAQKQAAGCKQPQDCQTNNPAAGSANVPGGGGGGLTVTANEFVSL